MSKQSALLKPKALKQGDKVAIVSLSRGILGESFVVHSLERGAKRLRDLGLEPVFMPNSLKGVKYLQENPEARADDLKAAFDDSSIKGIISAIGGDDGYRLAPYLLEDKRFAKQVKENPKLFTGFSDTTNHHLILYQLGLSSLYGHSFLTDLAELSPKMLPYTEKEIGRWFRSDERYVIPQSALWYEERGAHDVSQLDKERVAHEELVGHQVLQGDGVVRGELLGGCLESLYYLLSGERYAEQKRFNERYGIMPEPDVWRGKVVFLETSEMKIVPEIFRHMVQTLKDYGIFEACAAVLLGKPQDEQYAKEYQSALLEILSREDLLVMGNLPFGHAYPRTFLAYGQTIELVSESRSVIQAEAWFSR
ncbi:MAG: LD-carboxypeptidase [Cardiobacteriaceae bacterium]|nr:LD-carboxypeptidase [Cardiobacteriaceae bacterium]